MKQRFQVTRAGLLAAACLFGAGHGAQATVVASAGPGVSPTVGFELYLARICADLSVLTPITDPTFILCANTFPGGGAGAGGIPGAGGTTTNLGITAAQAQSSLAGVAQQLGVIESRVGTDSGQGGGASADWTVGRLSLFAAVQTGDSDRKATVLEQGYNSDTGGAVGGFDYRITDAVTAGASLGFSRNDSNFDSAGGSLKTSSHIMSAFVSWLPMDNLSIGGYLGYASQDHDAVRPIAIGPFAGTATSSFDGSNRVAGVNIGYDWYIDRSSVGVFANLDYSKSSIDSYQETGATGLEMAYASQTQKTLTTTLGLRGSHSVGFSWGSLTPEARIAWVHEHKDDARTITSALVLAPGTPFTVTTDSPDRNYYTLGLGVAAQLDVGPILFADYERWGGHKYIDSWTLNMGAIIPF